MVAIALRYDLRSPEWAATKHPDLYSTCLEQVSWAESTGAGDLVALSEHHGMEDGWMSSPFTMAAAICARTERIPVSITAAIVPLHNPIRLAEQIATTDLIARGRVSFVVGLGYAEHEFEMAGIDRKKRAPMAEEYVEVMRKAWTGEPFEYQGRMIRVTPKPFSQPAPPMFMGGSTEKSAQRAARLKMAFLPSIGDQNLKRVYDEECARVGYQGFCVLPTGPGFVHVTEDPEKAWDQIKRYALFDAKTYAEMQSGGQRSQVVSYAQDEESLRKEG